MSDVIRRFALPVVLIAGIAGAMAWALWPHPVPVDVVAAARGPMTVTVDKEGRTRVKDLYVISAPIPGRLTRIEAEVGDRVAARDTVLARILPSDPSFHDRRTQAELESRVRGAEAALCLARADVTRARAQLALAKEEFERADRLAKQGTVPVAQLDRARAELNSRRADMDRARAQIQVRTFELETANAALIRPTDAAGKASDADCCVHVRTPVDGQVLRLLAESESVVRAGEPLIEVGDPGKQEIVVDVLSADAVKIKLDAEVRISGWGGPDFTGTVRRVEPYGFTKVSALGIEEQRVNVLVDFSAPPDTGGRLGHGFRADTKIVVWQSDEVLQLPVGTLFRDGGDWAVYVVGEDDVARTRRIELGQVNGVIAEVLGGLDAGARVIEHPGDQVGDGVAVAVRGG